MRHLTVFVLFVLSIGVPSGPRAQAPPQDSLEAASKRGDMAAVRRYAEAGDLRAQKLLVLAYEAGAYGLPVDFGEAFRWEKAAAAQGDAESAQRVGFVYLYGEKEPPVAKAPKEAARWLLVAARGGRPNACAALADLCYSGTGVPKDPAEGRRWRVLEKDAMDVERCVERTRRYSVGFDKPPRDAAEGLARVYNAAMVGKKPLAMFDLGVLNLQGPFGFPRNEVEGWRLVKAAAEQGEAEALLFLGRSLRYGIRTAKDPAQARLWLQRAAAAGAPEAQGALGEMLVDGEGGPRDWTAAEPLLRAAAEARLPVSGLLYRVELEKDYAPVKPADRKPPIADALWPTVRDRGAEAAEAQYRDLLKRQPREYDFSEVWLNYLGYRLLDEYRREEAAALFWLNAQAFPGSFNVWDSLAEALALTGRKKEALENYRKSLALNPNNENAKAQIARLEKELAAQASPVATGEESEETARWLEELLSGKGEEPPKAGTSGTAARPGSKQTPPSGKEALAAPDREASERDLLKAVADYRASERARKEAAEQNAAAPTKKTADDLAAQSALFKLSVLNLGEAMERFVKAQAAAGREGKAALQAFAEKNGFAELLPAGKKER